MTETLRQALAEASEEMPAVRVPPDLWQAGRRRHRRRTVAVALTVAVLVIGAVVPLVGVTLGRASNGSLEVAAADAAVPARLHDPSVLQGTVQQSPNGPAAVLLTGNSGLSANDWPGTFGSKIGVVGGDGSYRILRYGTTYQQAAQDVLLSPNGRYVAGDASIESRISVGNSSEITIVDLVTGKVRWYSGLPAGEPVAWSPDGAHLVLWREEVPPEVVVPPTTESNEPVAHGPKLKGLWLLDVATGRTHKLFEGGGGEIHRATFVAFSPDGRQLAVQVDRSVMVIDTASGASRTLADIGPQSRLAGAGAWSPAGDSLAVFTFDGCVDPCTDASRNQRRWRLGLLDAVSGAQRPATPSTTAFDDVVGAAARIVGWQRDGDAVVLRYVLEVLKPDREARAISEPTSYRAVGDVELLALHPGGGRTRLIESPPGLVWDMDVARDLVVDDRFGGQSPAPTLFPVAPWVYGAVITIALIVAGPLLFVLWAVRRGRRTYRAHGGQPVRTGQRVDPRR